MHTSTHKLGVSILGTIFTGIAEWLHSNVTTLAGTLTVIYTLFCLIEKWPVICERTAAAWKRVRSWIPLLALCAFVSFAACGCHYVSAKKHVDAMKAESVKRVEAIQVAAKNVTAQEPPAVRIVTQPSAVQEAQASGVKYYYIGGALSGLVGLALIALTYRAAGIVLLLGAIAMPSLVNVATLPLTNIICAVILTAAVTFVLSWHIVRKFKYAHPLSPDTPAIVA